MRTSFLALAVCSVGLLAGCQPSYTLSDNMVLDLRLFGPIDDDLHLPYVAGTSVDITVAHGTDASVAGITFVSDDPNVLSVDSIDTANPDLAHCTAKGPGTAHLHVLKDGQEVTSTDIQVAMPTRAMLSPAGPALVGKPIPFDARGTTEVVNGGTATYQVQYFSDNTMLFGNGILDATSGGALVISEQTTFFVRNEWLQVTPAKLGPQSVELSANGVSLGTLTVDSVDPSAIQRVEVDSESADSASKGDTLVVLAQSFDGSGQPVFGVVYDWKLAGEEQTGEGDLFEFPFDPDSSSIVTASFGGLSDETSIDAAPHTGFVSSSNEIGCAVRPGTTAPLSLGLTAAIAALAIARRRTRSTKRAT